MVTVILVTVNSRLLQTVIQESEDHFESAIHNRLTTLFSLYDLKISTGKLKDRGT